MAPQFQPNVGQIIVGAFRRVRVQRTEITAAHMADARHEANLLQVQWGNKGPNLWTVDDQVMTLIPGQIQYFLPVDTVDVLDSYLSLGGVGTADSNNDTNSDANPSTPSTFDRILNSLGRSEYLQIPNKSIVAQPTSFWFEKGSAPRISFWPVPDSAYKFNFWRLRQIQDADPANAGMADVPYLWVDAFTAGLAYRLSRMYAPDLEAARKADADEAWMIAAAEDTENVPMYLTPNISAYYR